MCSFLYVYRYEFDPEQFAGNQIPTLMVGTKSDAAQSLREKLPTRASDLAEECGAEELNMVCFISQQVVLSTKIV